MKSLPVVLLLISFSRLLSQDAPPADLLPKDAEAKLQNHAVVFYHAANDIAADLKLPIQDERILLHLPKRGFPYLTALINSSNLETYAGSALFTPEAEMSLKSFSKEESVVGYLLGNAMLNRWIAEQDACYYLLKDVAPTPAALQCDQQAKALLGQISNDNILTNGNVGIAAETSLLQRMESIRILFDKLKDLPKLTPEQFANERAESAVLAPEECYHEIPYHSKITWREDRLNWHQSWDHQGYLLAFSESSGPNDYERLQMVVSEGGGIFEWCQPYSGSHFGPDSYESKLTNRDFHNLKDFVAKLPPSDPKGEKNHFVVSFVKDGSWVTRIYNSLPTENLLEDILKRMLRQSQIEEIVNEDPPTAAKEGFSLPADGSLK